MAAEADDAREPCTQCGYLNCHCDDTDDSGLPESAPRPSKTPDVRGVIIQDQGEPTFQFGQFRLYGDPHKLFQAIGKAQDAFETLIKDKEGFHQGHKYVPLEEILEEVVPKLRTESFVLMQPLTEVDGHPHVATILAHEDGDMLVSSVSVPRPQDMQDFGSNVTYTKRYSVEALLALAAQEDDDARHAAKKPSGGSKGGSQKQGGTEKRWEFHPENSLSDAQKQRLEKMGWNNSEGEPHWWAYKAPQDIARNLDALEAIGEVKEGGGS